MTALRGTTGALSDGIKDTRVCSSRVLLNRCLVIIRVSLLWCVGRKTARVTTPYLLVAVSLFLVLITRRIISHLRQIRHYRQRLCRRDVPITRDAIPRTQGLGHLGQTSALQLQESRSHELIRVLKRVGLLALMILSDTCGVRKVRIDAF